MAALSTDQSMLFRDKPDTYLPLPKIVRLYSPSFWETRDQTQPASLDKTSRRENLGTRLVLNMTCYLYPWVSFSVKTIYPRFGWKTFHVEKCEDCREVRWELHLTFP